MSVTATDARLAIVETLDRYSEDRVLALEARIRADLAATGPELEAALDAPPDPDSDWSRVSVEEVLTMERERLASWRDAVLERFDRLR